MFVSLQLLFHSLMQRWTYWHSAYVTQSICSRSILPSIGVGACLLHSTLYFSEVVAPVSWGLFTQQTQRNKKMWWNKITGKGMHLCRASYISVCCIRLSVGDKHQPGGCCHHTWFVSHRQCALFHGSSQKLNYSPHSIPLSFYILLLSLTSHAQKCWVFISCLAPYPQMKPCH